MKLATFKPFFIEGWRSCDWGNYGDRSCDPVDIAGICYVFLVVVSIGYLIFVLIDPADPHMLKENYEEKKKNVDLLVIIC